MNISEDNFPNNAFREYVLNTSGFDKDKDGSLSDEEIGAVIKIDVSNNTEITNLQGIEYFTSIQTLFCRNLPGLKKIDTSGCSNLEWLDCAQTGVAELDLSSNPNLKILDCHGSKELKELNLKNNTALRELDCYNTGIIKLDLSSNTNLRTLECYDVRGDQGVTELNVKNNVNLEELDCHGTRIDTLDISQNLKLSQLYCYSTNIKELDVSKNPKLWYLWCYNTNIKGLDVSQNPALEYLDCGNWSPSGYSGLAYLNIGEGRTIDSLSSRDDPAINLTITGDTFNILEKFSGIKIDKITNVSNADYDPATGDFKVKDPKQPVKYQYNCGTNNGQAVILQVTLNLTVQKGNSTITLKPEIASNLNKVYDGQAVSLTKDDFTVTGSNGTVNLNYYQQDAGDKWIIMSSDSIPVHGGNYRVIATLGGNDYYNGAASEPVEFIISPAENAWTKELSIGGWTYGEKANSPTAEAKSGSEVKFTYSDKKDGTYIETVPTSAGTWYVKAIAAATSDYKELSAIKEFTIAKAVNTWTEPLKMKGWTYGEKPNAPTAAAKYGTPAFQYSNQKDGAYTEKVPTSIGTWYVKAIVAGTANYSGLESETVSFTISQRWVPSRPTDGLHQGSGGELWYYKDGKINKEFEGIADYNGSQFYVKDGKVQKVGGLTLVKDKWYFLTDGRVQTQHTGLVQYDGEWFYITEGILDTSISGVVSYDGGEFVFTQGRLIQELNGLWLNPGDHTWYFIANGQVQRDYTGLALYDEHWFYVVKGVFDQTYTGLVPYDNAWFYVTKGELDTNISGVVPYDGGKFIFSAGRLANEVNGLWLNPKDKKWYFASNGQIQTQYTGVAMYDNEWFYIRKGILADDYNGTIQYNGATFLARAGQLRGQIK